MSKLAVTRLRLCEKLPNTVEIIRDNLSHGICQSDWDAAISDAFTRSGNNPDKMEVDERRPFLQNLAMALQNHAISSDDYVRPLLSLRMQG